MRQEELWERFFAPRSFGQKATRIWRRAGVETRHFAVVPFDEDVSGWATGARMRRFLQEATPLAKGAVAECLETAGLDSGDVGLVVVASCTGYATPGLDVVLTRDLAMPPSVERLLLGHMGCHAALPGLATLADAAVARNKVAILACIELASVHAQPPSPDPSQVVAEALFADAAAAVAVGPGSGGLELVDVVACSDSGGAELMAWEVTERGFLLRLSPQVPSVLSRHVASVVEDLLSPHGLLPSDVAGWAVHPGGPRILDVVGERLGLDDHDLELSREVLRDYGNCSSATVLLILQRLVSERDLQPGDYVALLAFGPGLTLYATLLRMAK